MLYQIDENGNREYVHIFDENKLRTCFETLADTTNEIQDLSAQNGILKRILECVNPAQKYRLTIPETPPVVVLRKALDLQLSKHAHDVYDLNTYVSIYNDRCERISLPAPDALFSSKIGQFQSSFKAQDTASFLTSNLLYRKMTFAEYMYLCNRRELPCNGNYFSPDGLWQYSPDTPAGMDQNHEVLVKFTLAHSLGSILDNVLSSSIPVYKEGGNLSKAASGEVAAFAGRLLPLPKKGKTECKAGIKIESDCISFRMGNGLKTGVCYIPIIQGELENIEVAAYHIVTSDEKYADLQMGDKMPMGIKFYEISYYYLPLLESNFTFNPM
ncbi:MAG: hypothetical protein LUK37_25715 [Clostridia bacterium]|nr:hypothetical protein [Clostridia bacterium]